MNKLLRRTTWITLCLLILMSAVSIPSPAQNFPPLDIAIFDSASSNGYYFIVPYTNNDPYTYDHPQLILDRFGRVIYSRVFDNLATSVSTTSDFKVHDNGLMSYFSRYWGQFYFMDSTFTVIDSLGSVNGFAIDSHDLLTFPDGHFMLIAKESRFMDISAYSWFGPNGNLPGGSNAEVIGVVIQEFDENKDLVWEWKAHDHFEFDDVDSVWLKGPNKVDWTHSNAIEVDADGNVLLSSRHFNEITKIDRQTDAIIWRMGGKENQFTFTNDTLWFNGQHDIRRISNGNITLFDNGRYHDPPLARALEYSLDETNLIATLEWEYFYDSAVDSRSLGNFQTLPNDNRLIDFGTVPNGFPWMVLVKPDKSKILEISIAGSYQSYRAYNYFTLPWSLEQPIVDCYKDGDTYYLEAEQGHSEYLWSTGATSPSIPVTTTGQYWVSVPHGVGFVRSRYIEVIDLLNPCLYLNTEGQIAPGSITLQCVPNPISSTATITFNLPIRLQASLCMTDMRGKEVFCSPSTSYEYGSHNVSLNVNGFSKGIYILRLTAGNEIVVRKVVVY